jgi:hypothetical protein
MKKVFVAFTEKGRIKGRISGSILILNQALGTGFEVVCEFEYSQNMNKGSRAEVVSKLVELGVLPKEAINESGYPEYSHLNEIADIIIIEGQGLNYFVLM